MTIKYIDVTDFCFYYIFEKNKTNRLVYFLNFKRLMYNYVYICNFPLDSLDWNLAVLWYKISRSNVLSLFALKIPTIGIGLTVIISGKKLSYFTLSHLTVSYLPLSSYYDLLKQNVREYRRSRFDAVCSPWTCVVWPLSLEKIVPGAWKLETKHRLAEFSCVTKPSNFQHTFLS